MPKARYTLPQFLTDYPDDSACLDALFKLRYANMTCCPKCGVVNAEFYRISSRKCYACVHCRFQLHPCGGTIFAKSSLSLRTWFMALYLFSVSKNGVSATELQRQLGMTYKCAWRVARQIRSAMKQDTDLLTGIVEADECYIGGRRRSTNRYSNKTPLLGVVQRKGRVRVVVTDHASATTAMPFLYKNVTKDAILNTDESGIYNRAHKTYDHRKVKHSAYEFARGEDYTNSIENFWGLVKPTWTGTHRSVSKKHMQLYVNERVWIYNHRQEAVLYPLLLEAAAQPVSKVP